LCSRSRIFPVSKFQTGSDRLFARAIELRQVLSDLSGGPRGRLERFVRNVQPCGKAYLAPNNYSAQSGSPHGGAAHSRCGDFLSGAPLSLKTPRHSSPRNLKAHGPPPIKTRLRPQTSQTRAKPRRVAFSSARRRQREFRATRQHRYTAMRPLPLSQARRKQMPPQEPLHPVRRFNRCLLSS